MGPSTDEYIDFHFSTTDLSGKLKCKAALQKELGLPIRPDCPLAATPELMEDDDQFVMLGSGDPQYENWMREAESMYRDKFRGWVGFSVPISHKMTAGFEPCGLNQLYAMRYGTVPVAHGTGGLRDTVENFNPYAKDGESKGSGWTFSPLTKESMLGALRVAISTYREDKDSWKGLMNRAWKRTLHGRMLLFNMSRSSSGPYWILLMCTESASVLTVKRYVGRSKEKQRPVLLSIGTT